MTLNDTSLAPFPRLFIERFAQSKCTHSQPIADLTCISILHNITILIRLIPSNSPGGPHVESVDCANFASAYTAFTMMEERQLQLQLLSNCLYKIAF